MSDTEVAELKRAIDRDDLEAVKLLMTRNPGLHSAPLGYGQDGPLTWVAECRGTWPTTARLAMARWMTENGSDIHQGGDGPLMRAALNSTRIPMMELLVSLGADVNAQWHNEYAIIFAPCEAVAPQSLAWLLEHEADPNCNPEGRFAGTALDFLIGSYERSPDLAACIDMVLAAGGVTRYDAPAVLDMLRSRLDSLKQQLDSDPALIDWRFPDLDFGQTGGRMLTLKGATLLHVAAEYGNVEAVELLLNRGADVNSCASLDEAGIGGQTALFHAVTQRNDTGLPVAKLLIARGADLTVRAKVPGHYERPGELIVCTPLGYAMRFQDEPCHADKIKTVRLLQECGAPQ